MNPEFNVSTRLKRLSLAAMLTLSASAHASSLVADGGFEAAGGGSVFSAVSSIDAGSWNVIQGAVYVDNQDPWVYDGNNSVNLTGANLYVPNTLSQTLSTVVGQTYNVSFWGDADIANTFSLTDNGSAVTGMPTSIAHNGFPNPTNSSLFVDYTGKFTATSTSTTLSFTDTGDPAIGSSNISVMIDDVNVSAAAAATPEPASIGLTLTGLCGLCLVLAGKRLNLNSIL